MGSSGSKEKTVAVEANTTNNTATTTPTNTPAAAPRYRPASKEAIAFRDATNAPAGGAESILNQKQSRFDQAVEMKSNRDYITEQEGLTIGEERKSQLAQQWRFILSAEPIQRGLDAGLIAAAGTAMGMLVSNKANRQKPGRVAFCSMMGFCVGMMAVPMGMVYLEARNRERIRERDRDMMQDQRDEFYKKASDSFEENANKE